MSTPGFIPQDTNSLTPVRYYTQFDPYHYATDNRPLTDLAANISTIGSGGGDSARRAVLITELALSSVFQELFSNSNNPLVISGLTVNSANANSITINPGAVYQTQALNDSISTPTVKQALLLASQTFNIVSPSSTGTSIAYVIEAQFSDLTSANMPTSAIPFVDATNTFLPCLLLNKELKLQLKAGTQAPTGSQAEPAVDAGWFPLYTIVATFGATALQVYANANAPYIKGMTRSVSPIALSTGSAVLTDVAGVPVFTFQKSGTQGVSLPISLKAGEINPYVPIKFKMTFSSDQTGGNFALRASYLTTGVGDSTSTAVTNTDIETVPLSVTANAISSFTTTVITIPVSAFSGFVSNKQSVNKEKLFLQLQRIPGNAADTNTGVFRLHDLVAFQ
ncbi:hypothetical protein D3C87_279760 [compost metagenome]